MLCTEQVLSKWTHPISQECLCPCNCLWISVVKRHLVSVEHCSEGVCYFGCLLSARYDAGHFRFVLKCNAIRGFILLFSFGSETDFQRHSPGWFSRKLGVSQLAVKGYRGTPWCATLCGCCVHSHTCIPSWKICISSSVRCRRNSQQSKADLKYFFGKNKK